MTDRWNPFMSLREAMERLLEEGANAPDRIFDAFGQRSFPIDLAESEKHFVLRARLPGMKPEDVQITLQSDTLTIIGTAPAEPEQPEQHWLIHEQRTGPVQRVLRLPAPVNAEQAQAYLEDGVLTLTLPKAEAARPQHIRLTSQPAPQPQQESARSNPQSQTDEQVREQVSLNHVEEASQESFPASDPPAWTTYQE